MAMTKMILAGFGGQGMLSMGQFFAYSAMIEGKNVTWLPSYGPEMRGGTANCSVIIADEEVPSPIISRADVVVVMNEPSLDKFENKIVPGGTLFVNSSLISKKPSRTDINVVYVDTEKAISEVGSTQFLNVVMLGVVNHALKVLKESSIEEGIKGMLKSKPQFIEADLKAYEVGKKFSFNN